MHLWLSLPTNMENGAKRAKTRAKEVIETDGGYEVRNSHWTGSLRSWTMAFRTDILTSVDHAAVESLWELTNSGVDTFNFSDERSGDIVRVRFDTDLDFTNTLGPYHHLDEFTIKQVRDVSPDVTVMPNITGSATVGGTLTAHDATFTGTPTVVRQWTANGVDIPSATGATYVPVSGDHAKLIAFYDTATDSYGGQTRVWAPSVGPVV